MIDEGGSQGGGVAMLSRGQERLLRYLGTFPDALSKAWDVPRDVSLPGLSDAMGVVRSGLNQPLNALLEVEFISVRVAHVLGGGSRRRQVYHITETGRAWLVEHPLLEEPTSVDRSLDARRTSSIVGRDEELQTLDALIGEHNKALIGGLSGVGKTTLLRAWAEGQSVPVRWATLNELSDPESILADWMPDEQTLPKDVDAMVEHAADEGPSVLVVDDLHRLAQRHQDGVSQLLEGLHERQQVVVLAGRLPLPDRFDWPLLHLGNLAPNDAKHLLGEHLEDDLRQQVAKALDGHPMAINLYREGEPLPEAGEDIQAFVKQTMLNGLTEEGLDGLDTMVLFPRPLSSEVAPGIESIEELDQRALLRWSPDGLDVEVQHLVRNVRRTMLDEERLMLLHQRAADHWEQHLEDPAYAVLHLYHQLALDREDLSSKMDEQFERLVAGQSGALAVIFDRATQQRSEDEGLHYWAGRIALHRQEHASVRKHLEGVQTDALRNELAYGLAVLEGQSQEAERLLNEQLNGASTVDAARWLLKAAVQRVDDRLFDEMNETNLDDVQTLLGRIKLPDEIGPRSSITVSMSLIQHTLALLAGDRERAETLVEGLESLSHRHDPIVLHARLKATLSFLIGTEADHRQMYDQTVAAQPTLFHKAVVGLTFVEHLVRSGSESALSVFETLPLPDAWPEMGTPHHRYAARWWYLKGHLDSSKSATALREAARCFRQAGCTNAARTAARRLHRVL